jgi:hypothetical protein
MMTASEHGLLNLNATARQVEDDVIAISHPLESRI